MQVSVIIPVYNAEKYIEKAVWSALNQSETAEVLFIDDGSTDSSMVIGEKLAALDSRVKIFQHNNGINKGPAATRNVGLANTSFEFIAFLDADDFFLENRFTTAKTLFQENEKIGGVYEAVGYFNYDNLETPESELLITMTKRIPPERLFESFFPIKSGYFSIIGLVIRKSLQNKVGFFDENLRQGEDTDFIWRLSLNGALLSGDLDIPVTMVGHHSNRGIYRSYEVNHARYLLFRKWFKKIHDNDWAVNVNRHIFRCLIHYSPVVVQSWSNPFLKFIKKLGLFINYLINNPSLFYKLFF
jgi:glycosyltransferase involved in cell wall biosynthesis